MVSSLRASIDLVDDVVRAVPVPVDARLRHDVGDLRDVVGARDDVHGEAAGQVPGYVAVESWDVC